MDDKKPKVVPLKPGQVSVDYAVNGRETREELFERVREDASDAPDSMIVVWLDAEDITRLRFKFIGTNAQALWLSANFQQALLT